MPSSPSSRLLLELQAPGENLNTWGDKLNTLFRMVEAAIRGRQTLAVSGAVSLASANYALSQDSYAWLDLSGTGGTLTIPARESVRIVRNGGSGDITITTGAGDAAVVEVGALTLVVCDAANVRQLGFQGDSLKAYIDEQLLAASAGNLPGQAGNGGKYLRTSGTAATWEAIAVTIANVIGFPAQPSHAGKVLTTNGSDLAWLAFANSGEVRAAASKIITAAAVFEASRSVEMTDAATIAPPAGWNFHCGLGASGRTIDLPTTLINGQSGRFALTTGGAWAINWSAAYKKIGNFPSVFASGGPHIFGYYYNGTAVELNYAGQRAA